MTNTDTAKATIQSITYSFKASDPCEESAASPRAAAFSRRFGLAGSVTAAGALASNLPKA